MLYWFYIFLCRKNIVNSTPNLQHLHSNSHGLFFLINPTFNKCVIKIPVIFIAMEVKSFIISGSWAITLWQSQFWSQFHFSTVYIFSTILSWSECDGPEIWWPATVYCMCDSVLWRLYCRCGAGAVVGLWGNMMLVVGPDKDWINFNFDNPVHLVEEEDGLRIIGKYQHEFLHKVPGNKWCQWFITKMIYMYLRSLYRLHTYVWSLM